VVYVIILTTWINLVLLADLFKIEKSKIIVNVNRVVIMKIFIQKYVWNALKNVRLAIIKVHVLSAKGKL
jgi:hypothetical protein